ADDSAFPAAYDRQPDRGGASPAPRPGQDAAAGGRGRNAPPGGIPESGPGRADLSVRAFGRSAPEGDDRHGPGLPTRAVDRRRADDGTGRHDPGPDPAAHHAAAKRIADGRD